MSLARCRNTSSRSKHKTRRHLCKTDAWLAGRGWGRAYLLPFVTSPRVGRCILAPISRGKGHCGFCKIHRTFYRFPGFYVMLRPIAPSDLHTGTMKIKKKWRPEGRLAICSNQLSVVLCRTKHLLSSLQPPVVSLLTHWS